ncbi:13804_t:CDS:2 [Ambispora leptoticha]|uniref:13804_t:CDS:1 n=1 Tax=Ambispora leptoticha TaxID=144679 RepID=A0A9N9G7B0_9GLOM|nr:13804_t:CDS:2 [Ambispora leptoticha]
MEALGKLEPEIEELDENPEARRIYQPDCWSCTREKGSIL